MLPGTFACLLMDAVLTHVGAWLAHPVHGHVPLGTGFPACSLVQEEAPFAGVAAGGISFTCSAGGATAPAFAIFCIEATVGRTEHKWRSFPTREGATPGGPGFGAEQTRGTVDTVGQNES